MDEQLEGIKSLQKQHVSRSAELTKRQVQWLRSKGWEYDGLGFRKDKVKLLTLKQAFNLESEQYQNALLT